MYIFILFQLFKITVGVFPDTVPLGILSLMEEYGLQVQSHHVVVNVLGG